MPARQRPEPSGGPSPRDRRNDGRSKVSRSGAPDGVPDGAPDVLELRARAARGGRPPGAATRGAARRARAAATGARRARTRGAATGVAAPATADDGAGRGGVAAIGAAIGAGLGAGTRFGAAVARSAFDWRTGLVDRRVPRNPAAITVTTTSSPSFGSKLAPNVRFASGS